MALEFPGVVVALLLCTGWPFTVCEGKKAETGTFDVHNPPAPIREASTPVMRDTRTTTARQHSSQSLKDAERQHSSQSLKDAERRRFPCWSAPARRPRQFLRPCFQVGPRVECRCSNTTLDCSSNHGRLQYVPQVFSGAQILNFSNNALRRLSDAGFFVNVSRSLWMLDLYNNNMSHLDPGALRPLRQLRSVLIGGNRLSYEALRPVFRVPTLNLLDLKCGGLGPLPGDYFHKTPAVRLHQLDMSWNNMGTLDMRALQPLKRLRRLKLWHNKLYEVTTAFLPSLEYVTFHKNRLFDFPATCMEDGRTSLFPNLTHLNLDFNVISSIPGPVCLPRLTVLQLQYNRVMRFTANMFSVSRFPALRKLGINEMETRVVEISAYSFNNSQVKMLDLGYNFVDFSSSSIVSEDAFGGCSALTQLYLNQNGFTNISQDKLHRFFRPLQSLEALYMAEVKLERISADTFTHLPRLKYLYLYGNSLFSLPDGAFDQLRSLRSLYLTSNHISTISSQTFGSTTRQRLKTLDLSGNPFRCGCDIVWFQRWMRDDPRVFSDHHRQGYRCADVDDDDDLSVADYFISDQACLLDTSTSILLISFSCFLLLLYVLFVVVFGYRWHLRLWLYALCRGRHQRSRRQAERRARHGGQFRYDVFLAYAEQDVQWVLRRLLPVLEGQWGLRVCVHHRDFLPGHHIVDNISDSVESSERVLMLFSPHFARSQWCQFELKFCQGHVMERDDVMVLLMVRETRARDMSDAMLALLRTTTYLEWGEEDPARASFWGRLALALNDVLPP